MEASAYIGLAAGVCTSAASLPQIFRTIKKQKATDVSPLMFLVLLAGNALWVWYGIQRADLPVMITNIVSVGLDLTMLFLRWKYHDRDR